MTVALLERNDVSHDELGSAADVALAASGDRFAFERVYRSHVGRVFSVCVRMTGDRRLAEELTQDVFVRAWSKLGLYRGESAFSTWLHRLAVNVILNARKTEGRERGRFGSGVDEIDEVTVAPHAPQASSMVWPSGAGGAGGATAIDLEAAIAQLPPGARRVFILHDVEGYKHEEIAQMFGITAGGSKAQLHRARMLLREALER
ncbi:MAG: RNA polymerase sigma factor [Gemmatimonadaceae bacterium]